MSALNEVAAEVEKLEVTNSKTESLVAPYSSSFRRVLIRSILEAEDGGRSLVGQELVVGGWVKTGRAAGAGEWCFVELNDGTCFDSLQVIIPKDVAEPFGGLGKVTPTSTSLLIEGLLDRTPEGKKQLVELKAAKILHLGLCDPGAYPIAKKRTTFEFLREKMHLRIRTNTIASICRIRNALSFATHLFFQQNGFQYVHTPIITANDCEGAGEMFEVTTLLAKAEKRMQDPAATEEDVAVFEEEIVTQGAPDSIAKQAVTEDESAKDLKKQMKEEDEKQTEMKKELKTAKDRLRCVGGFARLEDDSIDYSEDFFAKPTFLTVSGQLQGEYYACGMSNIYTFGPTFRAEISHTSRHLAEFWMIEPEMAFCTLQDDMQCAEDYVRFCCKYLLENCASDLDFICRFIDSEARERLTKVANTDFKRVSYTECIDVLTDAMKTKKKKFKEKVEWGSDLQSEHERYITEEVFQLPVIVYNYPKEIKAFYMKLNDDNKTVAAMDVLVPKVGELIGGSQREDNYEVLKARITECGMDPASYEGYLDLRRFGSVPHSGFGLGFERLILFATGMNNIRDVIPFPRYHGNAAF